MKRERSRNRGKFAKEHGCHGTFEYRIWEGMKARCHIPTATGFANYGGRGIVVCDRWRHSFEAFYADMGPAPSPQHSIEREDHDGPYAPENCLWLLKSKQNRNTRRTRLIEFRGKKKALSAWCAELGLPYWRTHSRIHKLGWPPERALTEDAQPVELRILNIKKSAN